MTVEELRKAAEDCRDAIAEDSEKQTEASAMKRQAVDFKFRRALTPERVLALCGGYRAMLNEMIRTGSDCSTEIEDAAADIEAAFGEADEKSQGEKAANYFGMTFDD